MPDQNRDHSQRIRELSDLALWQHCVAEPRSPELRAELDSRPALAALVARTAALDRRLEHTLNAVKTPDGLEGRILLCVACHQATGQGWRSWILSCKSWLQSGWRVGALRRQSLDRDPTGSVASRRD